jgi:hypothetical protein
MKCIESSHPTISDKHYWQGMPCYKQRPQDTVQFQFSGNAWLTIEFYDMTWASQQVVTSISDMKRLSANNWDNTTVTKDMCIGLVNLTGVIDLYLYNRYNVIDINNIDYISLKPIIDHITHYILNESNYTKSPNYHNADTVIIYNVLYGAVLRAFIEMGGLYISNKWDIDITYCHNTHIAYGYSADVTISRFELCGININ